MSASEQKPGGALSPTVSATARPRPVVAALVLLLVRGVTLWLLLPAVAIGWVLGFPYWRWKKVSLGQLAGWADLNLIAAMDATVLRPFVRARVPWTPLRHASGVNHRVSLLDLF